MQRVSRCLGSLKRDEYYEKYYINMGSFPFISPAILRCQGELDLDLVVFLRNLFFLFSFFFSDSETSICNQDQGEKVLNQAVGFLIAQSFNL